MKKALAAILVFSLSVGFIQAQNAHGNFKKIYDRDCPKCPDPWVGATFYKIWGVCPSNPSDPGQRNYCDNRLWNGGHWTSQYNLENIMRGAFTGRRPSGNVYVFIKPQNVNFILGTAGHIGWGFQLSDGSLYFGSTENYFKKDIRTYIVLAGQDNDFWSEKCDHDVQMFSKMKRLGYTQYKVLNVMNPNILAAKFKTEEVQMKGFQGISNNCLDHTYQILQAYGLNVMQLPSPQVFAFPNAWFNQFYQRDNSNGVYGHNL